MKKMFGRDIPVVFQEPTVAEGSAVVAGDELAECGLCRAPLRYRLTRHGDGYRSGPVEHECRWGEPLGLR